MPTILAMDNEYCTVRIETEKRMVSHVFKKYIYGDSFRQALSSGAELMEKHKAIKWLSDDRNNAALPKADMDWATGTWFPRVKKAGWKHWAVVLPKMVIGQMNMQAFIDMYAKQGVEVRVFDNPDDARAWIEPL
jgi:hypothetical protein